MAQPKGTHLTIDGGQVKDDEHIASYKSIPENDSELRSHQSNITKSKEKLSTDGAEEKLLQKENEAKIVSKSDMADAKYVVGDHRNGDAKIELDANQRQFAGLTKEELMKFADDPFWVRVRWFMFALFWVLWLAMLGGAVAIIVCAPKCSPPEPKTWYQKGPLIDTTPAFLSEVAQKQDLLPNMKRIGAQGLVVAQDEPYKVLDDEKALDEIKSLVNRAKEFSVKVIVDLTASFVLSDHAWFQLSANKTGEYADYFVWANGTDYDDAGEPRPPNNWVSQVKDTAAWSWSEQRKQFYYHQLAQNKPQLNFHNPAVVRQLDRVMRKYMEAGVAGVRLDGPALLVGPAVANDSLPGFNLTEPGRLSPLLAHWSHLVDHAAGDMGKKDTVFTVTAPELFQLELNTSFLRPPSAAPVDLERAAALVAKELNDRVPAWPLLQLTQAGAPSLEAAAFASLLPAAPLLDSALIHYRLDNVSQVALDSFGRLVTLRQDTTINHGNTSITTVPTHNSTVELLVCARWKPGHTGYAAIWNPDAEQATADLSVVTSVPASVTLYYASPGTREQISSYNIGHTLDSTKVMVPPKSTVVLSYVPKTTATK